MILPLSVTLNSRRALWRFVSRKSNQKTWTSQTGSNHTRMFQCEQSSATQKQHPNVYTTYTPDHISLSHACFIIQMAILFMRFRAQIKIYMVTPTLKNRPLKYGSEEKGSSLCKCSILLGFLCQKNQRGCFLNFYQKIKSQTSQVF